MSKIFRFLLIVVITTGNLTAQDSYKYWNSDIDLGEPSFRFKTFERFAENPELVRLDVNVEIVHDVMQFIKSDSGYHAKLDIYLSISQSDGQLLTRKNKHVEVNVDNYAQTNSGRERVSEIFGVELEPGKYDLTIKAVDLESKRSSIREKTVNLKAQDKKKFGISDLMLTNSTELDMQSKTPKSPDLWGSTSSAPVHLYTFFDIYRPDPNIVCEIEMVTFDREKREVYRDTLAIVGGEQVSSYFMPLTLDSLSFGEYEIVLLVRYGSKRVQKNTDIRINSPGIPAAIEDIDAAIEQLALIAEDEEVEKLSALPDNLKETEFIKFWNNIYPTSGDEENAKMREFYQRVDFTNRKFTNGKQGWRTDRGKVYIIYGKPTEVERHPFTGNQPPYEIWYYNHLNKRFIFTDEHGFGEYRLVTPIW